MQQFEQENRMRFRRENPFEILSDCLFKKLFRLTKPLVRFLVDILDPFLEAPTRISALDKPTKVTLKINIISCRVNVLISGSCCFRFLCYGLIPNGYWLQYFQWH